MTRSGDERALQVLREFCRTLQVLSTPTRYERIAEATRGHALRCLEREHRGYGPRLPGDWSRWWRGDLDVGDGPDW